MRDVLPKASLAGAFAALGLSACCVAPMLLLLAGAGGSWLALFGRLAAYAPYVVAASSFLLVAAWFEALRRRSGRRVQFWLAGGTATSALAWALFLYEATINDYLGTWM